MNNLLPEDIEDLRILFQTHMYGTDPELVTAIDEYLEEWYKRVSQSYKAGEEAERKRILKETEKLFVYHTIDEEEPPMAEKTSILEVVSKGEFVESLSPKENEGLLNNSTEE